MSLHSALRWLRPTAWSVQRSQRQALCFHLAPLWLHYGKNHTLVYTAHVTMQERGADEAVTSLVVQRQIISQVF